MKASSRKVIAIVDFDNCLVDTEKVFRTAQLEMLEVLARELEPYGIKIDPVSHEVFELQRKIDFEELKLRRSATYNDWGELPLGVLAYFVLAQKSAGTASCDALVQRAVETGWKLGQGRAQEVENELGSDVIAAARTAGEVYRQEMEKMPALFEGTLQFLAYLREHTYPIMVSEYFESSERQSRKVEHCGLTGFFNEIHLVPKKTAEIYQKIIADAKEKLVQQGFAGETTMVMFDDRRKYLECGNLLGMTTFWTVCGLEGKEIFREEAVRPEQIPKYTARTMQELLQQVRTELEK